MMPSTGDHSRVNHGWIFIGVNYMGLIQQCVDHIWVDIIIIADHIWVDLNPAYENQQWVDHG